MTRLWAIRSLVPGAAWWVVPLLVVIEVANLNPPGLLWIHWTTTIDVADGAYMLLAPLAAGVSCLVATAVVRRREMTASMADHGLRAMLVPALGTAALFSFVHLATLLVVTGIGLERGVFGIPDFTPSLVVYACFMTASGLGALMARIAPTLITPPFTALIVYGYEVFEPRVGNLLFTEFGGASVLLLGMQRRADVMAAQFVWLTLTGFLLVALSVWGPRAASRLTTGALLWALVIGATVGLAGRGETAFEEAAVAWACDDGAIEVCVAKEFEDQLPYFAPRVRKWAGALAELGLSGVPSEFHQLAGMDPPEGGFFGLDQQAEPLVYKILESSLPCLDRLDRWTAETFSDLDTVVAYLVRGDGGRLTPQMPPATEESARAALRRLSC